LIDIMNTIDRTSPLPLHHQFKQLLLGRIEAKEWQPGELIPSEQEFQDRYNLSRTTVRQALGDLVNEGWLLRQRGRGTQVARRNKVAYDPARGVELNEFMMQQGVRLGWRMLDVSVVPADSLVAAALRIEAGTPVHRIRRLRLADARVIGYHFAHVPERFGASINLDVLVQGGSLDYLLQAREMSAPQIQRTLEARAASAVEARLLDTRRGAPLLYLERLVTGADGLPVEFLQAAFCGDRFKYQITF
jgi:GntR family transcriptional regulator